MTKVRHLHSQVALKNLCRQFRTARREFNKMVAEVHHTMPENLNMSNKVRDMEIMVGAMFDSMFPTMRRFTMASVPGSDSGTPRRNQIKVPTRPDGHPFADLTPVFTRQTGAASSFFGGSGGDGLNAQWRMEKGSPTAQVDAARPWSSRRDTRRSTCGALPSPTGRNPIQPFERLCSSIEQLCKQQQELIEHTQRLHAALGQQPCRELSPPDIQPGAPVLSPGAIAPLGSEILGSAPLNSSLQQSFDDAARSEEGAKEEGIKQYIQHVS